MRKLFLILLSGALGLNVIWGADWASESGNPQRDGWAQGETELVKANIQGLRLLYKTTLDNESIGPDALTSPIVLGNLITYRGFKEMLFVGGSSDNVYSIDAALNQQLWKTHFDREGDVPEASATSGCPGGMTASIAIVGGSSPIERAFRFRRRTRAAAGPGVGPGQGGAAHKPAPVPDRPASSSALFAKGFGSNGYVFAIGSDGYLRFVRQSDGDIKAIAPVKFLPPNSQVSSINVSGTRVYAATIDGCGNHANALYAIDLGGSDKQVIVLPTHGSGLSGMGGTAVAADGTVYAQARDGRGDVAGKYNDTVLALDPEKLKVTDYFTPAETAAAGGEGHRFLGVTPAVFQWKGREIVVAGARDGSLYLLDGASPGGSNHHTPLCRTKPIQAKGSGSDRGIWGDFSTWEDPATQTRWVYAAVWGSTSQDVDIPVVNGSAANGSIVAFKVQDRNGQPALVPQWRSRNLMAPASPVTTNGLVFALSTGQPADSKSPAGNATMYVLDGATGKELFSSGDDANTFSHGSGMAIANGRVYFTTHDNTIYCYGLPAMQPQLTER